MGVGLAALPMNLVDSWPCAKLVHGSLPRGACDLISLKQQVMKVCPYRGSTLILPDERAICQGVLVDFFTTNISITHCTIWQNDSMQKAHPFLSGRKELSTSFITDSIALRYRLKAASGSSGEAGSPSLIFKIASKISRSSGM